METTTTITPAQQSATNAATQANGLFVSAELLQSKDWRENLVRHSSYFHSEKDEWIASAIHPRSIKDLSESQYQEMVEQMVRMESEVIREDPGLVVTHYLPYQE